MIIIIPIEIGNSSIMHIKKTEKGEHKCRRDKPHPVRIVFTRKQEAAMNHAFQPLSVLYGKYYSLGGSCPNI